MPSSSNLHHWIREMESKSSTSLSSSVVMIVLLSFLLCNFDVKTCSALRMDGPTKTSIEFIRTHCNSTRFPQVCFHSLASHAAIVQTSPILLAHVALSVSLTSARTTSVMVVRLSTERHMPPRVAEAMADCIESLQDTVDSLRSSIMEMRSLKGKNVSLKVNDIQTWVSTALTDENTCMDGFAGNAMNGGVKTIVRSRVVNVAQLTSNALALVGALAAITGPARP